MSLQTLRKDFKEQIISTLKKNENFVCAPFKGMSKFVFLVNLSNGDVGVVKIVWKENEGIQVLQISKNDIHVFIKFKTNDHSSDAIIEKYIGVDIDGMRTICKYVVDLLANLGSNKNGTTQTNRVRMLKMIEKYCKDEIDKPYLIDELRESCGRIKNKIDHLIDNAVDLPPAKKSRNVAFKLSRDSKSPSPEKSYHVLLPTSPDKTKDEEEDVVDVVQELTPSVKSLEYYNNSADISPPKEKFAHKNSVSLLRKKRGLGGLEDINHIVERLCNSSFVKIGNGTFGAALRMIRDTDVVIKLFSHDDKDRSFAEARIEARNNMNVLEKVDEKVWRAATCLDWISSSVFPYRTIGNNRKFVIFYHKGIGTRGDGASTKDPSSLECWENAFTLLLQLQKNGIRHNDIKPDNMVYDTHNNSIKMIDFGLSTVVNGSKGIRVFDEGGTHTYKSPFKKFYLLSKNTHIEKERQSYIDFTYGDLSTGRSIKKLDKFFEYGFRQYISSTLDLFGQLLEDNTDLSLRAKKDDEFALALTIFDILSKSNAEPSLDLYDCVCRLFDYSTILEDWWTVPGSPIRSSHVVYGSAEEILPRSPKKWGNTLPAKTALKARGTTKAKTTKVRGTTNAKTNTTKAKTTKARGATNGTAASRA
jgi:serine/threonine protein kinase